MADDPQYSTEDLAYVEIGWKDNSDQKWRSATLVVDVKIGFLEETCDMKAYHYKLNDGRHRFRRIIHPTHLVGPKIYGQLLMAALLGQYHVLSVTKKSLYRRNEDLKKISLFPLFSAITTLKMEEVSIMTIGSTHRAWLTRTGSGLEETNPGPIRHHQRCLCGISKGLQIEPS